MSKKGQKTKEAGHVIRVKVLPRSSRNQILGREGETYRVKLTASPVEGKANEALKSLLSKKLEIPKSYVKIVSGRQSRTKLIFLHGIAPLEVDRLLK